METTREFSFLQVLNVAEMLDRAFLLYRKNFLRLVGIMAVGRIPVILITLIFSWLFQKNYMVDYSNVVVTVLKTGWEVSFLGTVIIGLCNEVISIVMVGVLTRVIVESYLGESVNFPAAFRRLPFFWSLLGAYLLAEVINLALGTISQMFSCLSIFTLGFVIFFSAVVKDLIPCVVMLEPFGGWKAVRRAWALSSRKFWLSLGTMFSASLITNSVFLPALALVIWRWWDFFMVGKLDNVPFMESLWFFISTHGLSMISVPLMVCAAVVLYFNLRVRTEGFDLAWRAEREFNPDLSPSQIRIAVPGDPFFDNKGWQSLGILTGGSVIGIAALGVFLIIIVVLVRSIS